MQYSSVSAALVAFLATAASAAPTWQVATRVGTVTSKTSGDDLIKRAAADASGAAYVLSIMTMSILTDRFDLK